MFHAWVTAIFSHSSWSLCCTDGCFWFRHPELLLFYKWLRVHFSEWQIVWYCSLLFLFQHWSVCFVPQLKTEILFCILNSMVQEIVIKILDKYSVVGFPSGKKLKNLEVCLFSVGILFGIIDWFLLEYSISRSTLKMVFLIWDLWFGLSNMSLIPFFNLFYAQNACSKT